MPLEWREHRPNEWWQVFDDAPESLVDERGTHHPPSMVASWGGQGCCVHLHSYYNGATPDSDETENVDYLHVCDLDDLIEELQALREAMQWKPSDG